MDENSLEFKITYWVVTIAFIFQSIAVPICLSPFVFNPELWKNIWFAVYLVGLYLMVAWGFYEIVYKSTNFIPPIGEKLLFFPTMNSNIKYPKDEIKIKDFPGFIYIMRRADGIYKLGRTIHTENRLRQHVGDYGQSFELVKRFVVPDCIEFEKLALDITKNYHFEERGRNELRRMNQLELNLFLKEFESICKESVCK